MKKKIMMFILFAVVILFITPNTSTGGTVNEQQLLQNAAVELQERFSEKPTGILGTAYLIVYAITYTQGEGVSPCVGADVRVRGLFRSYNGTTNEQGIYIFAVHTKLLRDKFYFITASTTLGDAVVTKRAFMHLGARQIFYKGFLFLDLDTS